MKKSPIRNSVNNKITTTKMAVSIFPFAKPMIGNNINKLLTEQFKK